ncbi:MAG: MOSC N-terminal beta barrel domain-containing protein [Pseudomonadota bacterium]
MTVSEINIYPVKGLGGITLDQAQMTARGLKNDRRFMLVDPDHQFVSQRELPRMTTIWMELIGGHLEFAAPDREPIRVDAEPRTTSTRMVQVWASSVAAHSVSAEADEWLSDYLGADLRLVYMPESSERVCNPEYTTNNEIVSFADGFPVLITNAESLDDLNTRIVNSSGVAVPMNRFRSNLVVRGGDAWAEDDWDEIEIGGAVFRAAKPCARCQVTTTDQASGEVRGPEPLKTLSTFRNTDKGILFGVNLVPVKLGTVQVGDSVKLK